MRSFVLSVLSFALSTVVFTSSRAEAQCSPYSPSCGGGTIWCATPPAIGTTWRLCLRPGCNTHQNERRDCRQKAQ